MNERKLKGWWFVGITDSDQKKARRERIYAAKDVIDDLASHIEEEIERVMIPGSHVDYDNPSWAYKQADRLGYVRALKTVRGWIELPDRDDNSTEDN